MPKWKVIKKSLPFTVTIAIFGSAVAGIIVQLVISDGGVQMIKAYLFSLSAYYYYFLAGLFFLITLAEFYIG